MRATYCSWLVWRGVPASDGVQGQSIAVLGSNRSQHRLDYELSTILSEVSTTLPLQK